jgi:protein QN1
LEKLIFKKVDKLHLQLDQHRVDIRKVLAENEGVMRETRENYEEKIEQLRRSHQQEVKRLMAQQALEHSTSRMAELQSKVDTQEVLLNLKPAGSKPCDQCRP